MFLAKCYVISTAAIYPLTESETVEINYNGGAVINKSKYFKWLHRRKLFIRVGLLVYFTRATK